jgi:hypothetical protein
VPFLFLNSEIPIPKSIFVLSLQLKDLLKNIKMKKSYYTAIGFLLFLLGSTSLILSITGVQLTILVWMDAFGGLVGFLLRLLMIVSGIVIAALSTTNWQEEN